MQQITPGALRLAMQFTGSHDDALDILQNAVVKSLEHRNAPRPGEAGYKAWFYRVVHNLAIDWLRRENKIDRHADIAESVADDDPAQTLATAQRHRTLHQALAALPLVQREIICLKDFHDFSYAEIADIMAIEPGTVMSRLHRARLALREKYMALENTPGAEDGL
jgi:RNA polymerase sigma-70 factor (ECF subfamily)